MPFGARFGPVLLALALAAGAGQSQSWIQKINGPGLGNPLAVNPLDDDILYAAAGGSRVYISRDRGYTWGNYGSLVTGGGIVKSVAVSPTDTLEMIVGMESSVGLPDRVMKTTDGGSTWTETWAGTFSYYGQPIECSPLHPDTVYTMGLDTVYRSLDFGSTWDTVCTNRGFNAWCDAAIRADSAAVLYVGDNLSGIWKTADHGATWRKVYTSIGEIPSIAIDPFNPAVGYATKFGGGGGMLKTTNYGETWSTLIVPSGNRDAWWVTCSPVHPGYVYYGTYTGDTMYQGIYVSADAGASWTRINTGLSTGAFFNYGLLALDSLTLLALQSNGLYKYQYPTTIDVLQPDGDEYWLSGETYDVTWTASGLYAVDLEFSTDGGGTWNAIADSVPAGQGSHPWTTPAGFSESCLVRISDARFTSTSATSASVFTITDAYLTLLAPNGGEEWLAGEHRTIAWSSVSFDSLTVEYSADSGASWTYLTRAASSPGMLDWTVPDAPTGDALIRLRGADDTNVVDLSDAVFSILSPDEFQGWIAVRDDGAGADTLFLAASAGATDGIDTAFGESELPPPPSPGTFDARWLIDGTAGVRLDVRDTLDPAGTRVRNAAIQPGPGGYPMTLTWTPDSFTTGTLVMRDVVTAGDRVNADMRRDSMASAADSSVGLLEVLNCPGTPITIPGAGSWVLFSLPVETGDRRTASLFPRSLGGAYEFNAGYRRRDTIRQGEGYWIKTEQVTITGCPSLVETTFVRAGWNIIGGVASGVDAGLVTTDPDGLIVSPFWGYGPGGYFAADSLVPGQGYWVKCSDSGRIVVAAPGFTAGASRGAESGGLYRKSGTSVPRLPANRVTISSASGGAVSTLYFGPDSIPCRIEAPPPPPGEWTYNFSPGSIGVLHDPHPEGPIDLEIGRHDADGAIIFSWEVEIQQNLDYILVERLGNRETIRQVSPGSGTMPVSAMPESKFLVRVLPRKDVTGGTPTEFSMGECYPNPFNPSTRVQFTIPSASTVSIAIFNLLGERVASAPERRYPAGVHVFDWSARADDGSSLGSGVYFMALTATPDRGESGSVPRPFRAIRKAALVR